MNTDARDQATSIRDHIRAYVKHHPHAADTPTGVRTWWLPRELSTCAIEEVLQALAELAAQEELREISIPGGDPIYSAAHS